MANADEETMHVLCPECRTSFKTVMPELSLIPKHLRPFIQPSVRRLYLSASEDAANRIKALERDKQQLLRSCERHQAAAERYRQAEHHERQRAAALEAELNGIRKSFVDLSATSKTRVKELHTKVRALEQSIRDKDEGAAKLRQTVENLRAESRRAEASNDGRKKKRKTISPPASVVNESDDECLPLPALPIQRAQKSLPRRHSENLFRLPTSAPVASSSSARRSISAASASAGPPTAASRWAAVESLFDNSSDDEWAYIFSSAPAAKPNARHNTILPSPARAPVKRRRVESRLAIRVESSDSENDTDDDLSDMYPTRDLLFLSPRQRK